MWDTLLPNGLYFILQFYAFYLTIVHSVRILQRQILRNFQMIILARGPQVGISAAHTNRLDV